MVQHKGKRQKLIVTGIGVGVLLLLIGIFALARALNPGGDDPYKQEASSQTVPEPEANASDTTQSESDEPDVTQNDEAETESSVDPSTVSTLPIEPLGITVSYVSGVGGFEYVVQRTASGTQYVQFRSSELAGTKCTDDTGAFASILQSPSNNEQSTISETKTVEGKQYGLSLADATCTSNPELLRRYQASFRDAFSLLKKS